MSGLNSMIQELHSNLIKDINESKLPVGIVFFVLKDIFNETERSYINSLNMEKITKAEDAIEEAENDEN